MFLTIPLAQLSFQIQYSLGKPSRKLLWLCRCVTSKASQTCWTNYHDLQTLGCWNPKCCCWLHIRFISSSKNQRHLSCEPYNTWCIWDFSGFSYVQNMIGVDPCPFFPLKVHYHVFFSKVRVLLVNPPIHRHVIQKMMIMLPLSTQNTALPHLNTV